MSVQTPITAGRFSSSASTGSTCLIVALKRRRRSLSGSCLANIISASQPDEVRGWRCLWLKRLHEHPSIYPYDALHVSCFEIIYIYIYVFWDSISFSQKERLLLTYANIVVFRAVTRKRVWRFVLFSANRIVSRSTFALAKFRERSYELSCHRFGNNDENEGEQTLRFDEIQCDELGFPWCAAGSRFNIHLRNTGRSACQRRHVPVLLHFH